MSSNTNQLSVNEILDARQLQETMREKRLVSSISTILLQTLGILVWIALSLTIFPWLVARSAIDSELWGYVGKRLDNARTANPAAMVTFPYSSWQVAMSLTGWFPGMYTSIFFGSGPRSMIPAILFYSCISPVQNSSGQSMSALSADPPRFAIMLGKLDQAFEAAKATAGESPEMAVLCKAWELAGESFSSCTPPKSSKGCSASSIAMSAMSGALGGGFAGHMYASAAAKAAGTALEGASAAAPEMAIGALVAGAAMGVSSAWSQGCFGS